MCIHIYAYPFFFFFIGVLRRGEEKGFGFVVVGGTRAALVLISFVSGFDNAEVF